MPRWARIPERVWDAADLSNAYMMPVPCMEGQMEGSAITHRRAHILQRTIVQHCLRCKGRKPQFSSALSSHTFTALRRLCDMATRKASGHLGHATVSAQAGLIRCGNALGLCKDHHMTKATRRITSLHPMSPFEVPRAPMLGESYRGYCSSRCVQITGFWILTIKLLLLCRQP